MGRQNVANIFSMRTGRIDVVNPHDHDKTMVFTISRISPCMFMNIDMMSQCSVFRKTQQAVTASGHSNIQQDTASRSHLDPENTATQWIPSAPLELADLLGFCSWKVAWKN